MHRSSGSTDSDRSNGYEAVAQEFMASRSQIGAKTVLAWSRNLPSGAAILELGCGHGVPISKVLVEAGFQVYGVDASQQMVESFRSRFPQAHAAHEAVEESNFFNRTFDAALAIGLLFLLTEEVQINLIRRVASVLPVGGRFLFTSPVQVCEWRDVLTGRLSRSLGRERYEEIAVSAGLTLVRTELDEGENHYFDFVKV